MNPGMPPTHLVTGANAGIGLEIARGLARAGAHVVLACRDRGRGEGALATIREDVPGASLELLLVDVSSQASIRSAAAAFTGSHDTLDVLVNNAAVVSKTRQESVDGIELTFATNVLGYHLLTGLLLPALKRAAAARVVNVASMMAYGLELDDVEWRRRPYDASTAYAQSKQANRMLTWALARRLAGTKVTANAMHPGAVGTPLLAALAPGMRGRTTTKGAETAVWLAASPEVAGVSGKFYSDLRESPCKFRDETEEDALVKLCDDLTRAR
jgi:NAD(P)-dependent dehydrogenase (short-subunit alcohol dehydrogenase family)